jgi:hypothetical protein
MKNFIVIKSISDLITNSSSEVFCYINGPETEIDKIHDVLDTIFGWNQECEITSVVDRLEDTSISVDLPHSITRDKNYLAYWEGAMHGLLSRFNNCKMTYEQF